MHVYEQSLGSACCNKAPIQRVKRRVAVLLITSLPVIITAVFTVGLAGSITRQCCVPSVVLEPLWINAQ